MKVELLVGGFEIRFKGGWDLHFRTHTGLWYILPHLEYTMPIKGWHAWGLRSGFLCWSLDLEKWHPSSRQYKNR